MKVAHNEGNQTTGSPTLVGIHSYHDGGANTDNPKNRSANEPKRTEGLFITTPTEVIFPPLSEHHYIDESEDKRPNTPEVFKLFSELISVT